MSDTLWKLNLRQDTDYSMLETEEGQVSCELRGAKWAFTLRPASTVRGAGVIIGRIEAVRERGGVKACVHPRQHAHRDGSFALDLVFSGAP